MTLLGWFNRRQRSRKRAGSGQSTFLKETAMRILMLGILLLGIGPSVAVAEYHQEFWDDAGKANNHWSYYDTDAPEPYDVDMDWHAGGGVGGSGYVSTPLDHLDSAHHPQALHGFSFLVARFTISTSMSCFPNSSRRRESTWYVFAFGRALPLIASTFIFLIVIWFRSKLNVGINGFIKGAGVITGG